MLVVFLTLLYRLVERRSVYGGLINGRWSMVVHLWNQLENEIYVDAFETTLFDALYLSSNITVFISSKVHFSLKCFWIWRKKWEKKVKTNRFARGTSQKPVFLVRLVFLVKSTDVTQYTVRIGVIFVCERCQKSLQRSTQFYTGTSFSGCKKPNKKMCWLWCNASWYIFIQFIYE